MVANIRAGTKAEDTEGHCSTQRETKDIWLP